MHSSKRIALTTFGSYGDIHPYMAIALELASDLIEEFLTGFQRKETANEDLAYASRN